MAVTFVDAQTSSSGGVTVQTLDVTAPSNRAAGNLLLLAAAGSGAGRRGFTTPPGWTSIYNTGAGTFARRVYVRIATGDSNDEPTLTLTTGIGSTATAPRRIAAIMAAYSGIGLTGWSSGDDSGTEQPWVTPSATGPDIDLDVGGVMIAFLAQSQGVDPEGDYASSDGTVRAEAYSASGTSGPALVLVDKLNVTGEQSISITNSAVGDQPVTFATIWTTALLVGGVTAQAQDRLRSAVNESVTSLLESVDARPADARASEHFTYAQDLSPLQLTAFREATRAPGGVDFTYFPRPVQNTVMENRYDGVTILSRLATYYPPSIFDSVSNLSGGAATSWSAQQVINYVLEQWSGEQAWLAFNAVPDLRLRISGSAPGDYGDEDGVVSTETVTIDQSGDARRDALAILQDLLSPFPGAIVRQDSHGRLDIVPTYGPDADGSPIVELEDWDCYSVSVGKPDPFTVFNRATVRNEGFGRSEDVQLMQPAWFQIGSNFQLGRSTWYEPPSDRLNLQPPDGDDTTLQESLSFGEFTAQIPGRWPISSSSIPAGTGIGLKDSDGDAMVTAAATAYQGDTQLTTASGTLTILEDEIPLSGVWVDAFRWNHTAANGEAVVVTIRARWDAVDKSVQFGLGPCQLETGCFDTGGCDGWVVEFTLNDNSVGYASGVQKSATFGVVEDGDALPTSTGGNALQDSQVAYGVREATLNIRGYDLDITTLKDIAEAYVLANITPRVTRDVELSSVGTRLTFDHIGRLIELPGGEQGFLVALDYGDDFTARSWRKTAQVQLFDPTGEGAVDETDDTWWFTTTGSPYRVTPFLGNVGKFPVYEITEQEE